MSPVPNGSESAGRGGRCYVSRSRFNGPNPLTVVGAALAPLDLDPQTGLVMTRM
jgi:hypothetical protein